MELANAHKHIYLWMDRNHLLGLGIRRWLIGRTPACIPLAAAYVHIHIVVLCALALLII
jgi:hypothetical protein